MLEGRTRFNGPTFTLVNRLRRAAWQLFSLLFFRFSPVPCHRYRLLLLILWGAKVSLRSGAHVYPDARIWAPWNLALEEYASIGPRVNCYNIAKITVGPRAIVSQGAYLCTGTHDYDDPDFPLYARPIALQARSWVCTEAFVGPGVTVHEGAVLGARAVATKDIDAWQVHAGNPASYRKTRNRIPGN
ncbi:putative colanic acid biosynthesis acetyltransferase [Trinickia symbiotica]|uniref:Putative colanic acid biosynthesis acetyltransferase n=1 Tax=Trinickia symbiotica TaxID=863227 RepID=A0A2N7X6A4_9BURK|nr:putative colanic acid biosynthesis acetyltransferase [Trinickia symbiotica]